MRTTVTLDPDTVYGIAGLGVLAALISTIGAQRMAFSTRRRAKDDEDREDG